MNTSIRFSRVCNDNYKTVLISRRVIRNNKGDDTIRIWVPARSRSMRKQMFQSFSISQILILAGTAILVLAYVSFLAVVFARYYKSRKSRTRKAGNWSPTYPSSCRKSTSRPYPDQVLPNGRRRKDYHSNGYSDSDIEYWGLDRPSASEPLFSGWVIADMIDSDLDGEINFW